MVQRDLGEITRDRTRGHGRATTGQAHHRQLGNQLPSVHLSTNGGGGKSDEGLRGGIVVRPSVLTTPTVGLATPLLSLGNTRRMEPAALETRCKQDAMGPYTILITVRTTTQTSKDPPWTMACMSANAVKYHGSIGRAWTIDYEHARWKSIFFSRIARSC